MAPRDRHLRRMDERVLLALRGGEMSGSELTGRLRSGNLHDVLRRLEAAGCIVRVSQPHGCVAAIWARRTDG